MQHVPPAWIEQLRPGGMLLADLKGAMAAGNLAALHRHDEPVVEGRFCAQWSGFMPCSTSSLSNRDRPRRWAGTFPNV